MEFQNTKYTLGIGQLEAGSFPPELANSDGLITLPVIFDPSVGVEIGLFWLDRTPFVKQLAAIRPFELFLRTGIFHSTCGPLMWMLFFVPKNSLMPFASVEYYLNPSDPTHISHMRRIAYQTHWHLMILGAGNKVADFFEFENNFDLNEKLDSMEEECRGMRVTDFMRAKQEFWDTYSMDDLFLME